MRWLRALAALVVVVSLASAAHVTYAFVQPVSGPDRVAAQVAWLDRAIADGAPTGARAGRALRRTTEGTASLTG